MRPFPVGTSLAPSNHPPLDSRWIIKPNTGVIYLARKLIDGRQDRRRTRPRVYTYLLKRFNNWPWRNVSRKVHAGRARLSDATDVMRRPSAIDQSAMQFFSVNFRFFTVKRRCEIFFFRESRYFTFSNDPANFFYRNSWRYYHSIAENHRNSLANEWLNANFVVRSFSLYWRHQEFSDFDWQISLVTHRSFTVVWTLQSSKCASCRHHGKSRRR